MSYTIDYLRTFRLTGHYALIGDSPDLQSLFNDDKIDDNNFKINHYLATLHLERKKIEVLERPLVESILKKPLPNPQQQVDNLIRLLSGFDRMVSFVWTDLMYYTGSQNSDMFHALMEHLWERNWITEKENRYGGDMPYRKIMLTIPGWERFAQLQKGEISYNKGFMAMQFDNKILQNVLENHFKPAMRRIGFELTKLNDIPKPGLIDNHMLAEIQTSDFIVADLSNENRGVYLEAGYAMGLGKTVIYTCEETKWKEKEAHFDVNHYQIIQWNKESPEVAANNLVAAVRAGFPDKAKTPNDE